jgi:copper(I)-binding protein
MRFPAALSVLVLAACHGQAPDPAAKHEVAVAPGPTPSVGPSPLQPLMPMPAVSGARLVLPAVPGHPGAAYLTVRNPGRKGLTIDRIAIAGAASTQMHETKGGAMAETPLVAIAGGQSLAFAPGGHHVMVFGIGPTLTAGRNATITVHFDDGKVVVAPLKVEKMGGDDDMAGMKM